MAKSFKRNKQVGELIQHEVAMILRKEMRDPSYVHLTVREVEMSSDLSNAKIYVSLLDPAYKEKVMKLLDIATPKIRHYLGQKTALRYVPRLRFVYDDTQEKAARIDALLKPIIQDKHDDETNDES